MRCRLLAIDLDGTLLRDDGLIDPRDSAAIASARSKGVTVTLCTGRMPFRTLPFARTLGLDEPLICGDGTVTVMPWNAAVRSVTVISRETRFAVLQLAAKTGLPLLLLTPDVALALKEHEVLARTQFETWADRFEPLPRLSDILESDFPIVSAFFLGEPDEVRRAAALYAAGRDQTEVFRVRLPGEDAFRVLPAEVSKGTALAELAHSLGIPRDEVAAVGDWYNDIPMLKWARWSFAMGHAPEAIVRAAATKLTSTAATGGAIAELVSHFHLR